MNRPTCRRTHLIVIIVTSFGLYVCCSPLSEFGDPKQLENTAVPSDVKLKYILQWTESNAMPFVKWGRGRKEFIRRKCKINYCYVTSDISYLKDIRDFDAIAFHGPEIRRYKPSPTVRRYITGPTKRSPHQKYVFVSMESSHNYPMCDKIYDDFFNWTLTYKLDSDEPYGYITIKNSEGDIIGPNETMHWMTVESMDPIDNQLKASLSSKKKAAAWFASNCRTKSKREDFVKKVQKELDIYNLTIDLFGKCGSKMCPIEMKQDCMEKVKRDYYFYFSLENSFAEDYVTEKLLSALMNDLIPVVFGAANYTRFMPEGIYLHGGKLKPKELAREMFDIIKDKERYYSFFKWRNHYSYHDPEDSPDSDDLCRMCAMLHDPAATNKTTVYKNFRNWWNIAGKC